MTPIQKYLSKFPEAFYPPKPNDKLKYASHVVGGMEQAMKSKVIIASLVRDNIQWMPHFMARVRYLGSYFSDYKVVLFENDSKDGTVEYLDHVTRKDNRVKVRSVEWNEARREQNLSQDRKEYMAKLRNSLLDLVRENYNNEEYVIITDSDLQGGFSYEGVMHSMSFINEYSIIGSNSLFYRHNEELNKYERLFYDAWAFRKIGHESIHDFTEINMLRYDRGQDLVPVYSCFGGLAIYHSSCLLPSFARYHADDCDHPTLHKILRNRGYTLALNPSQITVYTPHYYSL